MNETWVTEGHTMNKVWQDESITSNKEARYQGLSTGLKIQVEKEKDSL